MMQCVHTTDLPSSVRGLVREGTVVSATIGDALLLDADALARATQAAYDDIRAQVNAIEGPRRHIVRMWNFVPRITDAIHDGLERYMAFNAGRFEAMCQWYGGADALPRLAPAASAVGCAGEHAVIHALAVPEPGEAIQNPRQTPAMHYSHKFGPKPPCFARGTRLGDRILLISGTAAIAGEDSICLNDLGGQLQATVLNLQTLIRTAFNLTSDAPGALKALRVYLPQPANAPAVDRALCAAFGTVPTIEYVHAALCRRELLVEIEGVAVVERSPT